MLKIVELPYLWYIVALLPKKRFFERSFILSSLFTVPNNRRNIRTVNGELKILKNS